MDTADTPATDGWPACARQVEFLDYGPCLPARYTHHLSQRVHIDGVDVTRALCPVGTDLHRHWRLHKDPAEGVPLLVFSFLPGCLRLTPDVFGPGNDRVELLVPRVVDPIGLQAFSYGDHAPVTYIEQRERWSYTHPDRAGAPPLPVRREQVRVMFEHIVFRPATEAERATVAEQGGHVLEPCPDGSWHPAQTQDAPC